jgi:hypothetical protein
MDWNIIGGFIGMTALLAGFLYYILGRLEKDITSVQTDIKQITINLDSKMDSLSKRMDSHASRIDQLYRMFVDLLKENK